MKVLIAGAAGRIGRVLTDGLARHGHHVVGVDQVPARSGDQDWRVSDCGDPEATRDVFEAERPDAVIHLAGQPGETSLPDAIASHILTTAALLDASVQHGVRRFAFASSNHAVGFAPRTACLDVTTRPRPDTFYGVGKVAAEALLSLYADRYGISTIACRIGSFRRAPTTLRELSTWLSPGDCVRLFAACLAAPGPGFAVVYGISANSRAWWDLEPGRALGYHPVDNSEDFADGIAARVEDVLEAAYVGGPLATETYRRSAWEQR
ncbi:NAD-dependent epimerase/dehydratase family protein [Agromyces sp. NPDC058484]|uniref:NAD-dependent epimerase/dehydratase family protein n=1 Tax=Agromyces sp. NPDC058484 TaxID=3346524 RepID=UPI003651CEA0